MICPIIAYPYALILESEYKFFIHVIIWGGIKG